MKDAPTPERRAAAIQDLIEYFCRTHAEDRQDGTDFDCAVIEALRKIEAELEVA